MPAPPLHRATTGVPSRRRPPPDGVRPGRAMRAPRGDMLGSITPSWGLATEVPSPGAGLRNPEPYKQLQDHECAGSRVVLSRMLCRFLPCAYQCICVHYSALGVHFASAPPKYHASTRLFVAFLCVAYPCMLILCCIFIEFPWAAFLCISLVAFVSMRCYFVLRRIRQHSHPVYTTCIWTHMHCIS